MLGILMRRQKVIKTKKLQFIVLIATLFASAPLAFWDLSFYFSKKQAALPIALSQKEPPSPIVPLHDSQMVDPLPNKNLPALTNISLRVEGGITRLRFVFNREVFYQVISVPRQHRFIINFTSARLAVGLPLLDYINSAVNAIKVVKVSQEGLKIVLEVNPATQLQQHELNKEGKFPELRLDLISAPTS